MLSVYIEAFDVRMVEQFARMWHSICRREFDVISSGTPEATTFPSHSEGFLPCRQTLNSTGWLFESPGVRCAMNLNPSGASEITFLSLPSKVLLSVHFACGEGGLRRGQVLHFLALKASAIIVVSLVI